GGGVANAIADEGGASPGATWPKTPVDPANKIMTTQKSLSTCVFTCSVYHGQPASPREKRTVEAGVSPASAAGWGLSPETPNESPKKKSDSSEICPYLLIKSRDCHPERKRGTS